MDAFLPLIQCLRRFSSCYVEAMVNVATRCWLHAQVGLIAAADREFFEQSRCAVAESIQNGVPQNPYDYCAMRGLVRLTRRESAFEIGDEQVTEYGYAVLQGVWAVINVATVASMYLKTLLSKDLRPEQLTDVDTCFEELKQTFLLNLCLDDFFVETEEVPHQKVRLGAGTHCQIADVMEKIVFAMTRLPRFYLNELLDAAFPCFLASLQRNSEYFAMAKSFLAHTETRAPFAALCLEGLLANLGSLDTDDAAPPLWLELARLALCAELTEDTETVYCCFLLVALRASHQS